MAIKDLQTLLSKLEPKLDSKEYVFCLVNADSVNFKPLSSFLEDEGISVICTKQQAESHGLEYETVLRRITLTVYSSLEAVGLTAAVSEVLTTADISANVVAAYCHDHVFVPAHRAEEALELIRDLSNR